MSISLLRPFDMALEITAKSYAQSLQRRLTDAEGGSSTAGDRVSIGIIGGGLMGTAIAATHLKSGCPVRIFDADENVLAILPKKIAAETHLQLQANRPEPVTPKSVTKTLEGNLTLAHSLEELRGCDMLFESIPERLNLKRRLYTQLEKIGFAGFLFTNTSTIEVTKLAALLERPERFCGFHFFHPVRKRSLVEIVKGKHSAPETLQLAVAHARRIEKIPLLTNDSPGFLVNRLLNPLLREAIVMLEEGTPLFKIEESAKRFGMPMGPFRIIDEIGLDVTLHAGWVMNKAFPQRAVESPTLLKMIELGRLGRKAKLGFLKYTSDVSWENEGVVDPALENLLPKTSDELSGEEIAQRLFLPMLCEALRAVEEKVVPHFWQTDLAVLLGLGFPESRGGICFWADALGLPELVRLLQPLQNRFGERFAPPQTLLDFAQREQSLSHFSGE